MQEIQSLPLLQNKIKRSPAPYREEFLMHFRSFQAQASLFELSPKNDSTNFSRLCEFISQVSHLYKDDTKEVVAPIMMKLLEKNYASMDSNLRKTLLQCLILLRHRGHSMIDPERLIELCFKLFACRDKLFREMLYSHIVHDIRSVNLETNQTKLNKSLQNLVYSMMISVNDSSYSATSLSAVWGNQQNSQIVVANTTQAKKSLNVVIELYKKRVWTDARTVNVIASACFSTIARNAVVAMKFFLGIDVEIDKMQEEVDDEELTGTIQNATMSEKIAKDKEAAKEVLRSGKRYQKNHAKKTRSRLLGLKALQEGSNNNTIDTAEIKRLTSPRFPAIEMINDPQGFVERLFKRLQSSTDHFEVRLVMMDLISRVTGWHKLVLLPFYSYIQRYMQPHQEHVTSILAYFIQASHELIPPEELEPTVKLLANNFVNDKTNPEVMAVGLNAITELIKKVPLITELDGMDDLFSDLVGYRSYRAGKSVVAAARGVLNQIREINPAILQRKLRGKDHDPKAKPSEFGHLKVATGVDGADLLLQEEMNSDEGSDMEIDEEEDDDDNNEDDDEEDDVENEEDDDESENGEINGAKSVTSTTSSKKSKPALPIEATRILTQEDFERIKRLKRKLEKKKSMMNEKKAPAPPKKKSKIGGGLFVVEGEEEKDEEEEENDGGEQMTLDDLDDVSTSDEEEENENEVDDGGIDPHQLHGIVKRRQIELKDRLEEAYKASTEKAPERTAGTTNEQKRKKKNYLMVAHSRGVKSKQKKTLFEQRNAIKQHIKKLEVRKKTLQKIKRKSKR